jgi:hypothetical protein
MFLPDKDTPPTPVDKKETPTEEKKIEQAKFTIDEMVKLDNLYKNKYQQPNNVAAVPVVNGSENHVDAKEEPIFNNVTEKIIHDYIQDEDGNPATFEYVKKKIASQSTAKKKMEFQQDIHDIIVTKKLEILKKQNEILEREAARKRAENSK